MLHWPFRQTNILSDPEMFCAFCIAFLPWQIDQSDIERSSMTWLAFFAVTPIRILYHLSYYGPPKYTGLVSLLHRWTAAFSWLNILACTRNIPSLDSSYRVAGCDYWRCQCKQDKTSSTPTTSFHVTDPYLFRLSRLQIESVITCQMSKKCTGW